MLINKNTVLLMEINLISDLSAKKRKKGEKGKKGKIQFFFFLKKNYDTATIN